MNSYQKNQNFSVDLPLPAEKISVIELGISDLPPESLFPLLKPKHHEALLLSGGQHPLSQYSFIGLDPFLLMYAYGKNISIKLLPGNANQNFSSDPFTVLRNLLNFYKQKPWEGAPPFLGGGIGYLSYELGRHLERLPDTTLDDLCLPELYFAFYRSVLSYNHSNRTYTLFNMNFHEKDHDNTLNNSTYSRVEQSFKNSQRENNRPKSTLPLKFQSHFSQAEYIQSIQRILKYIEEGDIYQVNLSQRFHTPYNGDPYGLFLKLYQINPAPFFAYLNGGPFQIISSSPERFLHLQRNQVETRPIKGTLPRGKTPAQDTSNRQALLESEKNRAELAMIIDLLRNDLGRVCTSGSIYVKEPARLEAYTNVFHLVSVIKGVLPPHVDCIDLLQASFPGGSITGCPKIRSMEIIDEMEPTVRSVYTGSIGYLGWDGSMDLNIAIRTLILKDNDLYCQVGGGIVYDSDPQSEYEETLHKAASIKEALASTCLIK